MTESTIDYMARAKAALKLLDKESSWFRDNRSESEAEGWPGDEDLGGRFLLVMSDKDAESKT